MLTFPESFFKDEVRCDFLISEMMKRAWAAHLKILDELQTLFNKYGLVYYADFGTLLGAVRHQGIIPWDDDIDISMPRADFMKFLEHAGELPEYLRVLSVYNSDTFINFHAVATNNTAEKLAWDQERFDRFYGCPFICYIDIFPMDYVPRNEEQKKLRQNLYSFAYKTVYDCIDVENGAFGGELITLEGLKASVGTAAGEAGLGSAGNSRGAQGACGGVKALLAQVEELQGFLSKFYGNKCVIDEKKSLRNQLCRAAEFIAASCHERDADRVDYAPHMAYLKNDISRRKEWVKETVNMPFEVMEIAVPRDYHDVLVSRFGEKYMTPMHQPSTHEYPYYRTQVEVLIGGDTGEMCPVNQNKKAFLEALGTFDEVHEELRKSLAAVLEANAGKIDAASGKSYEAVMQDEDGDSAEDIASVRGLVADLQDGAVGIGEAIESISGEGTLAVKKLEAYCEGLYHLYERAAGQDGVNGSGGSNIEPSKEIEGLNRLLSDVKRSVAREIHDEVPTDWLDKLFREDGSARKVIVYGVSSIEVLVQGGNAPEKINSSFDIYKENAEDICVIFDQPDGFMEFLEKTDLELAKAYREAVRSFAEADFCVCPGDEQTDLVVSLADAYYGDKCPLMDRCRDAGIPVMIQNYGIK